MTLPGKSGNEVKFAQFHPPAFQEARLIGVGEALQLDRRDPMSTEWIWQSKQDLSDALEERSLHRWIEPRHEHLQVGVEKAQ